MICTASWFARLPPTHRKIGVSRVNPKGFELALTFPALHPGYPNLDRFAFVRSGPRQLDMFTSATQVAA